MDNYTQPAWQAETDALYQKGGAPRACPHCGRTGFYGPRQNEERTRHYRFCKFCGFGQDVGGVPTQYRATVHGCAAWRQVAGAPYIWWVGPEEESYPCAYCGKTVTVAQTLVTAPHQDPAHPWWQVPQGLSHAESTAFWEARGYFRLHL